MSGILRLENLNKGTTLKQGDKTVLSYRLSDADGEQLDIAGKTAVARLMHPDFTRIGYESEALTVSADNTVQFSIDSIIPSRLYYLEITVDGQYIFPSRSDEGKLSIDRSSMGAEITIIENAGIDAVVRKAVDLINEDPSLIIDEDKLISEIIANTAVGSIEEYYQEYRDAIKEYADLKPKAEQSISKSAEALSKSQNALNVANGIDAKATEALSKSTDADALSKSVQSQFNQVVIDGDSSVEAAQARVDASGQTNPTLKARLDKEHNEVTTQLENIALDITTLGAKADANYYDEETQKYYTDSTKTTESFNNTFIFRNAVNFLHENGGGTIYVPAGKYCFRHQIFWKSDVSMRGAGMGTTFLYGEGNVFDLIKATEFSSTGSDGDNPEAWLNNVKFEDFQIDLKGFTSPYSNVNGKAFFMLYMKKARFRNLVLRNTIGTALGCDFLVDTVIENVYTFNAGRNYGNAGIIDKKTPVTVGQAGIGIGTGAVPEENVVIKNCFTYNSGNYGIFVETQRPEVRSKFAKIVNNHAEGNRIGISNRGSSNTLIDGNSCFKNDVAGILINHGGYGDVISNNYISENERNGLSVLADYDKDVLITNNKINKNKGNGIFIESNSLGQADNIKIKNNDVDNNDYLGIAIRNNTAVKHKNIEILNNTIYNNNQAPGNEVTAIVVRNVDNLQLKGNTFYDDQAQPTQKHPATIDEVTGFIDGNDFGEEREFTKINYSSDIIVGDNVGLKRVASGEITFAEGEKYKAVPHNLGNHTNRQITFASVSPMSSVDQHVYLSDITKRNQMSLGRATTNYELRVLWEARVDY